MFYITKRLTCLLPLQPTLLWAASRGDSPVLLYALPVPSPPPRVSGLDHSALSLPSAPPEGTVVSQNLEPPWLCLDSAALPRSPIRHYPSLMLHVPGDVTTSPWHSSWPTILERVVSGSPWDHTANGGSCKEQAVKKYLGKK